MNNSNTETVHKTYLHSPHAFLIVYVCVVYVLIKMNNCFGNPNTLSNDTFITSEMLNNYPFLIFKSLIGISKTIMVQCLF